MYLYVNATDPRVAVEIQFWENDCWNVSSWERKNKGGLLASIDEFLKSKNKKIFDLSALFVFMGKGSFSATRSVATVANGLAFSLNLPVMALTSPPKEDPKKLLEHYGQNKYVLPVYSEPARIG